MKHQLTTESDHEKDQNVAISQRSPMRDTCNQSEEKKIERLWSSELGEGEKSRCCKKKKTFKERDRVENPGEGAAGALVFLGINDRAPPGRGKTENQ